MNVCMYAADRVRVCAGDDVGPARQSVGAVVECAQDEVTQYDTNLHGQDQHSKVTHPHIRTYIHTKRLYKEVPILYYFNMRNYIRTYLQCKYRPHGRKGSGCFSRPRVPSIASSRVDRSLQRYNLMHMHVLTYIHTYIHVFQHVFCRCSGTLCSEQHQ